MKVINVADLFCIPLNFTGICKVKMFSLIIFLKNGNYHNENGPALEYAYGQKDWCYKGVCHGINNDFTNETWKELIKEFKRQQRLKIFK